MLGLLTDWYRTKRASQKAQLCEAETLEAAYQNYGNIANRYVDVDSILYGFGQEFGGGDGSRRTGVTLAHARAESRKFSTVNSHARNVLNQIVNFTVGSGFAVKFDDEAAAERWKERSKIVRWKRRRREIMRRIVRDGEAILRQFDNKAIRFVEPAEMATPPSLAEGVDEGVINGVRFEPGDVESVIGYYISGDEVPVSEVYHFKDPFRDLNEPRGWPLLYDAISVIDQYERWVRTRAVLNELRSAVLMLRKHKGGQTPAQVTAFADRVKSGTLTRHSGKSQRYGDKWLPGTVIDHTEDVEYEFPGAHIDAGSVKDDGRAMRLLIACFFSFPEYWVTADASNANFASTLVAENPGIMAMRSWQEFFSEDAAECIDWIMGEVVDVTMTFPNLVSRDELKDTQSRAVRNDHGVLSQDTWMELDRLNPADERRRMAQAGEE